MAGKRVVATLFFAIGIGAPGFSDAQLSAAHPVFATSEQCIACHSNMQDADGHDVGIGHAWRGTMMALSAKDPYWMAGVQREIAERPHLQEFIEDKCSVCHMPMARTAAVANGGKGKILKFIEDKAGPAETRLANDGVSCTVCHQISADNFGERESFDGGYIINTVTAQDPPIFGPFDIDTGRHRIMQSAAAFQPKKSEHIQESELCATCHTLFTPAVDGSGNAIGQFAEQTPYLEWQHSAYAGTTSCQDCHMPATTAPISSILGEPREGMSQHAFRGGNAFMLGILDSYRDELGVTTPADDLQRSVAATTEHLQTKAASLEVVNAAVTNDEAVFDIRITNRGGHKLPSAYPSRRVWLHVTVTDQSARQIFESGALNANGSIVGNDNDVDGGKFEPHYDEIVSPEQVQIYEPIVTDYKGDVTTSLLSGVRYVKDNRLLPGGFDKATASDAVSVNGAAAGDEDFEGGGDTIRYRIAVGDDVSSVNVSARLLYQTIGYRWAHNLAAFDLSETNRFVRVYEENAGRSAVVLADTRNTESPRGAALLAPMKTELKQALMAGMQKGPSNAISVCKVQAPAIAESLSVEGVKVGRTSHRLRNPENRAPEWVNGVLQAYLGDKGNRMPRVVPLANGREGYVEPIVIKPLCLACHGKNLVPEVATQINTMYPDDEATGFEIDDLRGVYWAEYPASVVTTRSLIVE
jgi:hypothetical protein